MGAYAKLVFEHFCQSCPNNFIDRELMQMVVTFILINSILFYTILLHTADNLIFKFYSSNPNILII